MGSSSNNKAQKQAEENERERQRQITETTGRINSIFDDPSRQAQYDKLSADTQAYYMSDLDRQKAINDRKLKFALARSGQTGGTLQADQGRQLGENYLRGVIDVSRRAQGAAADLRSQDEQARMNLIAMAQSGLDVTTAGSQAASSLRNNLLASQAGSTANSLGDAFANMSDVYDRSRDAYEYRRGQKDFQGYYKPLYGYGGS